MAFYIVVTVICVTTFTADMILRYMEKIRSFGMEYRLHNIKGKTIPIQDFVPYNITMVTVFGMALGIFGMFTKALGLHPFIGFPISVMFGAIVNFIVMHFLKPLVEHASGDELSGRTDISGSEAVCTETIPGDGYGRISVLYHGKNYEFEAISEYETDIDKGEKVYILYREEQFCVVEKISEVLDVINEKPESGEEGKPEDK